MVLIVEHVHQICIKGMHIVEFRKLGKNLCQPVVEALLGVFNFAHIKTAYSSDFVVFVNDRGRFSLRFR